MKKFTTLVSALALAAGLQTAAWACGGGSACKCSSAKTGVQAGWFTGAGTVSAAPKGSCCSSKVNEAKATGATPPSCCSSKSAEGAKTPAEARSEETRPAGGASGEEK